MKIFVKTLTGKTVTLDVDDDGTGTCTVASIKSKLHEREGIPPDQQLLIFAGRLLTDDRTLRDYDYDPLTETDPFHLVFRLRQEIYIKKHPSQKTISLTIYSDSRVKDVKHMIHEIEGIPVDQQVLLFQGHTLEDPYSMKFTFDKSCKTLHLLHLAPLCKKLNVRIKTLTGEEITCRIEATDTVDSIKTKIEDSEKTGIPVDQQRLWFEGKPLEGCCSLNYYHIEDGQTLCLKTVAGDNKPSIGPAAFCSSESRENSIKMATLQENKAAQSQLAAVHRDNAELEGQIAALRQDKAEMEQLLNSLQQKNAQLKIQAAGLQKDKDTAYDQLKQYQEFNGNLKRQLAALQQELPRQQRHMATLRDRVREAERREHASEMQVASLQEELSRQRQDMAILQERTRQGVEARESSLRGSRIAPTREDQESWVLRREDVELTDQELGRGGWGMVRVAKLHVAAKCLYGIIVSEYNREMFAREMSIAAKVHHPNLVQFFGATMEGEPVILMEKMLTSLRSILERTPLNPVQITSISLDIARGLSYLHEMQPDPIIHRDVSSANVLLNPGHNRGYRTWVAKISDYGSANIVRRITTANPGSPAYAAPEAGDPSRQSPKMDVYSYGVLLLEICTRRFPDPDTRDSLVPTVTHPQAAVLIPQCLQHMPQDRPAMATIAGQL